MDCSFWDLGQIVINVIALSASLLTIITFFKRVDVLIRHKIVSLISLIFIASIINLFFYMAVEKNNEEKTMKLLRDNLKSDAKIVADGIVISGWESAGDFVGYLSQVKGFYWRHKDKYLSEYEFYSKELETWQNHMRDLRLKGKRISIQDKDNLGGLVSSAEDNLEEIYGKQPHKF